MVAFSSGKRGIFGLDEPQEVSIVIRGVSLKRKLEPLILVCLDIEC